MEGAFDAPTETVALTFLGVLAFLDDSDQVSLHEAEEGRVVARIVGRRPHVLMRTLAGRRETTVSKDSR